MNIRWGEESANYSADYHVSQREIIFLTTIQSEKDALHHPQGPLAHRSYIWNVMYGCGMTIDPQFSYGMAWLLLLLLNWIKIVSSFGLVLVLYMVYPMWLKLVYIIKN